MRKILKIFIFACSLIARNHAVMAAAPVYDRIPALAGQSCPLGWIEHVTHEGTFWARKSVDGVGVAASPLALSSELPVGDASGIALTEAHKLAAQLNAAHNAKKAGLCSRVASCIRKCAGRLCSRPSRATVMITTVITAIIVALEQGDYELYKEKKAELLALFNSLSIILQERVLCLFNDIYCSKASLSRPIAITGLQNMPYVPDVFQPGGN